MRPTGLEHELRERIESRYAHYRALLEKLVSINSFTCNPSGVRATGELVAAAASELGMEFEFLEDPHPDFGDHLFAEFNPGSDYQVVLVGHLDTVYSVEEETRHDFRWREDGPVIYGPGIADMQGGMVMALLVLDALSGCLPEEVGRGRWLFACNAAEERMSEHFYRTLIPRIGNVEDRLALVFEPALSRVPASVVSERKGRVELTLHARGRDAHAGTRHGEGINAIAALAGAVVAIDRLTDYERDLTVNVGKITGGTVVNRVPSEANGMLEVRAWEPEALEEAVASIRRIADAHSIQVDVESWLPSWMGNEGTRHLVDHWQATADSLGMAFEAESRGGGSDACFLQDHLPTLDGLGPAGANLHCARHDPEQGVYQESLWEPSFVPRACWNALAVARWLGR